MTDQTLSLTIDGQLVHCPSGWTIYQAAASVGIHIPTFCHHPKLEPVGACRTCLVEVEGMRGLQTSCTTPARDGMVVRVSTSPAAVKAHKAQMEFLLTNHPLDCPVCDKGGECPLQNQTMADGPGTSRYIEPKRHKKKRHPLGELIVLDQERCVLCWRCIRFLDEWAGDHELDLFGRGAATCLDVFPGQPLSSKWQGNTIDLCPVGALTSRVFRFEARVWELTNTPSICPMCSVGCNILLGVKNNQLRRIVPRENMQVNDAWICDKGRFGHGFVDHPERLTTPLIRRDGKLEPATWGEALETIAGTFHAIIRDHGPQAIAGLGSTRATNEANYLFQRFIRSVVGGNNVDHLERFPAGTHPLGSLPDLERKDVILLLGLDPSSEVPLVELWIKKGILHHGARVIVAHARQTELCRYGGPWLSYRPGGEITLLNGLARAILEAGPRAKMARLTNMDEFRAWLEKYTPEHVEKATGVPAEALQQAAHLLARAERPALLIGPQWLSTLAVGLEPAEPRRQHSGSDGSGLPAPPADSMAGALEAVGNLSLLLGGDDAAFVPGDNNALGALDMGVVPNLLPGQQPFTDKIRNRFAGVWGGRLSPVAGLNFEGMLSAAQDDTLKAMWILGADPVTDCRVAGQAVGRIPFLVVQDLFMTETASTAEVVLPAASFAESDGTFVNLTGRLQAIRAARRPPGQAQPDWWIITTLARRMLDSKRQRAWEFQGAQDVFGEICRVLPGYRGVNWATIGEEGWQPPAPAMPTRRTFVRVETGLIPVDPEFPLTLVTGRVLYDRGTLLSRAGRLQNLAPAPFVMIHQADAAGLGLSDGEEVSVVSAVGRLELTLRVSDEVSPGVAFAPLNLSAAPLSVLFPNRWASPRVRIVK